MGTFPDSISRVVILVDGSSRPVLIVVQVIVAIGGGHVRAAQGIVLQTAVALVGDRLVCIHCSGVSPEGMNVIVTKHAAAACHKIVTSAVGAIEAVRLQVIRVHEPVALVDVIRIAKGCISRGSGPVVVVAHVGLVDVRTLDVVDMGVACVVRLRNRESQRDVIILCHCIFV